MCRYPRSSGLRFNSGRSNDGNALLRRRSSYPLSLKVVTQKQTAPIHRQHSKYRDKSLKREQQRCYTLSEDFRIHHAKCLTGRDPVPLGQVLYTDFLRVSLYLRNPTRLYVVQYSCLRSQTEEKDRQQFSLYSLDSIGKVR